MSPFGKPDIDRMFEITTNWTNYCTHYGVTGLFTLQICFVWFRFASSCFNVSLEHHVRFVSFEKLQLFYKRAPHIFVFSFCSIKTIIVSAKQRPSTTTWTIFEMDSWKNRQGHVASIVPARQGHVSSDLNNQGTKGLWQLVLVTMKCSRPSCQIGSTFARCASI